MTDYLITDTEFALMLRGEELVVNLKKMRLACPCANCKGEKDVFGNIYKGPSTALSEAAYQICSIKPVGNYALQIIWKDGHTAGIYTFDFLKTLEK